MIQLLEPRNLLWFFPLVVVMFFVIRKKFYNIPEDNPTIKRKKTWQRWIFVSRVIIVALLVIALAKPFGEVTRDISGDPKLTVLIDNSSSMEVFDLEFITDMLRKIEEEIPINVRYIGSEERSDLGEGILSNLEEGKNILLISDGYNNEGANLGDVSLFTSTTNSTVSAINLIPTKADVAVSIIGAKKIVANLNTSFAIRVTKPGVDFYNLKVSIDGVLVKDVDTNQEVIFIDKEFSQKGYHTIKAEVSINGKDHFPENNVFYKTVNVIEKPRILYVSEKTSALDVVLGELYEVNKVSSIPSNINEYYAVVVNDMAAEKFRSSQDKLSEFLIEGNGLIVFGGFNSFDRGNYKNSVFEQLLPVRVGTAERTFGDNTVVISIDRSSGGGKCRTIIDTITKTKTEVCSELSYTDVIKAQALELIDQFDQTNRVGAIAFDTGTYLIEPIDSLYNNKGRMTEKIKRIQPGGNTLVSKGIQGAYNLLSNEKGNKYVVLLTDGVTWQGDQEQSVGLAGSMFQQGIKVITVGIGRSVDEGFLKSSAANGGGFYVSASNKGKLKVLFGDPEQKEDDNNYGLFIVNTGHFITREMEPDAVMQGYNQVLPKSSADLVISTDSGEPVLTTWRYGLGKVAAWTVFTGDDLGDLLNERNSLLLTRTVNWAIGDPERKKAYFVSVDDGRIGKSIRVEVKSDIIPNAEDLNFVKIDKNLYETSFLAKNNGFGDILDAKYAINYPSEYEETGFNPEMENIVGAAGGKLFKHDDTDQIVDFVKSVSKKTIVEKTTIVWPFVLGALLIFLLEIMLRRISENRRLSK